LIKKLEAAFGEDVKGLQECKTPSAPGEAVVRPQDKSETISEEDQKTHRSGVGALLHLPLCLLLEAPRRFSKKPIC
jgi:hypothetical protein